MNKLSAFKYPIILIPLLMLTGPFLPDLILSIASISFIIFFLIKKEFQLFSQKFFLIFIIFCIFISINSFISESLISMQSSFFYFRFGIFILVLQYFHKKDENFLKNFKNIIAITLIALFIDSLVQYSFGQNLIGYIKESRISSFFGEEKILGSFVIKFMTLYLSLYFFVNREVKLNIHLLVTLSLCIFLILISNERSALGLFTLYIFLISLIFFNSKKKALSFLFAFLIFISSIILSSEKLSNRYVKELISQFTAEKIYYENENENKIKKKIYIFTEAHEAMYLKAFKMFKDKPFTGHGTKTFRLKCKDYELINYNEKYGCSTHPHNYYIQMLAENGIVGLLFLISVFILLLFKYFNLINKGKNSQILNLIVVSNIVCLWPILPHGNFFNNWNSIFIFLNFAFYFCIRNSLEKS